MVGLRLFDVVGRWLSLDRGGMSHLCDVLYIRIPTRRQTAARVVTLTPGIRSSSPVDVAAASVRNAIATGELGPGQRIKEIPVAASLGLSRGPVREALRLLVEEGLVTIVPNVGASVAEVRYEDLMELYAQRLSLGALGLRSIAGSDDLDVPAARLQDLAVAVRRKDPIAAVEADLAFQDELVRRSSLQRTVRLFERTTIVLRVYAGMLGVDYRPRLSAIHREDAALLSLVRSGDLAALQALWRRKLEGWLAVFVAQVGEQFDAQLWRTTYVGDVD
jgi:DNA-binding GntR family transcriptional regulator